MSFPQAISNLSPSLLWWLAALLSPCFLALPPAGSAQKGGRP